MQIQPKHTCTQHTIHWPQGQFLGAPLTHICAQHGCLCLPYDSIKSSTVLDITQTRETDITNARQWSDEADSCCSCLNSHHAQASHFLTCILMQHCHMSCWAGNQHEDKHKQHWKSYMQGNGQFESGSCCLCTNSQHAHVMQTCRSSLLTHKALAGL